MPTILELLGIKHDEKSIPIQGESLGCFFGNEKRGFINRFFGEKAKDRIAFAETGGLNGPWPSPDKPNVTCVRTPSFKLIHNLTPNDYELYDLINDPMENTNIYGRDISVIKFLRDELDRFEELC